MASSVEAQIDRYLRFLRCLGLTCLLWFLGLFWKFGQDDPELANVPLLVTIILLVLYILCCSFTKLLVLDFWGGNAAGVVVAATRRRCCDATCWNPDI
jgi:hypothetical protein